MSECVKYGEEILDNTLYKDFSRVSSIIDTDDEYTNTEEVEFSEECPPKFFNSIANDDDILQMYLKDIGKIKLLSGREEKALGREIKEGEKHKADIAKRKLIQANLRLVVKNEKKL